MIKFEITDKTKYKARKRRQKNEKKWLWFRIPATASFIISIVSFIIGIFLVPSSNYAMLDRCMFTYAILLACYACIMCFLRNMSSHWIQDRLNERLWIENDILYHFVQKAFSGGWNYRSADETAFVYEYHLSTIRNAKYDPKSGRIEFDSDGRFTYFRDYTKGVVEFEHQFNGAQQVFYEYMKPSLYTYLKDRGVNFDFETTDFKLTDSTV